MLIAWFFICAFADITQVPVAPPRRTHYIRDAERNLFSDIELLPPLIVKGHYALKERELHYPNTDAYKLNPNIQRHKPDYVSNNLATAHDSREKHTKFIENGKMTEMKSVKKDLINDHEIISIDLLKDIVIKAHKDISKPVPFKLLKVCDRLLKQTKLKLNDIKVEIAVHYCKELLDTVFEKGKSFKDTSYENRSKVKSANFTAKGSVEKESSKECNHCTRYKFGNLDGLKNDESNYLYKMKVPIHLPPVKLLGSFGPYAGRRD